MTLVDHDHDAEAPHMDSGQTVVLEPEVMVPPMIDVRRGRAASFGAALGWGLFGMSLFVGAWALLAMSVKELPTPAHAGSELWALLQDPFHNNGVNDKGIALQLWSSLQRVFWGFLWATIVGVPVGLLIGTSRRAWQAVNPLVQLLRPVSPLAWFPIWLVVFKDAPNAAIWVIFMTALWPIILNSAAGGMAVPLDQRNVAKVFHLGRLAYVRRIVVPHSLPSIVTGLRTSMGVAWMVIVAVEMLSGGEGIGFFVWDAYNASNLGKVAAAIVLIGLVGLILDSVFLRVGRLVTPEEVHP